MPGSTHANATEKTLSESLNETATPTHKKSDSWSFSLEENERNAIIKAYKASHGNLTKTARMLGIGRATLYRKLTKFGLENLKSN